MKYIIVLLLLCIIPRGVNADTVSIGSSLKSSTKGSVEMVVTEHENSQFLMSVNLNEEQFLFGNMQIQANTTNNGFTRIKYRANIKLTIKKAGFMGIDKIKNIDVNRDLFDGDYIRFSRHAGDIYVDELRSVEIRIEMYSIVKSTTRVTIDFSLDTIVPKSIDPVVLNRSLDIELIGYTDTYPSILSNVSGALLRYVGKSFIFLPVSLVPDKIPWYNQSKLPVDINIHVELNRTSPSCLDFLELNINNRLDALYLREGSFFKFELKEVPYDDILEIQFKYEGDRANIHILDIFISFPSFQDPELYAIERSISERITISVFSIVFLITSYMIVTTFNEIKLKVKLEENSNV